MTEIDKPFSRPFEPADTSTQTQNLNENKLVEIDGIKTSVFKSDQITNRWFVFSFSQFPHKFLLTLDKLVTKITIFVLRL